MQQESAGPSDSRGIGVLARLQAEIIPVVPSGMGTVT